MYIYLDLIMLVNFSVDFLLILATNRLTGFPPGYGKAALGAAIGGVYGALCVLPELHFMSNHLWRTISLLLIGAAAFGVNRRAVRRFAIFVLLTMALAGIVSGSGYRNFLGLMICSGLLWLLCRTGFSSHPPLVQAELLWNGHKVRLLALRDTGNTLRDPVTGEQVLVCGADVGEELLGLNRSQISNPVDTVCSGVLPGLRLIPYHSVGQPSGMMLGLRLNQAKIGDRILKPVVAFAPQEIGRGEDYQMLTGGML